MRDNFHLISDTWPRGGILRPKNEPGIREDNGTSLNAPECSFKATPPQQAHPGQSVYTIHSRYQDGDDLERLSVL